MHGFGQPRANPEVSGLMIHLMTSPRFVERTFGVWSVVATPLQLCAGNLSLTPDPHPDPLPLWGGEGGSGQRR